MKRALIIIVGNKFERAIKSIEHIRPNVVYFIYNGDYDKYIKEIRNKTNLNYRIETREISDFQSISEAYLISKDIFKEVKNKHYEIHVGVSNGTKALVAGLSLASVGYDCHFVYVGSTPDGRDKDGTGEVIPGHEKVMSDFHPMKKQATLEISRGKRYFNKYLFEESIKYFEKAKEYLEDTRIIDIYIKIAKLYQEWDKFKNLIVYYNSKRKKYSDAQLDFYLEKQIYNEIIYNEKVKNHFYDDEKDFVTQIKKNIDFLDKKISRDGLINENDIYYYLPDLLNNAERRIGEEKYDDATARLYRASELIAQIRLYELGFVNKRKLRDHKVFHLSKLKLIGTNNLKVIEYVARKPDFQDSAEEDIKLPLSESYTLLELIDDDLAKIKEAIGNELKNRNDSILAHGLEHCNEEDAINLLNKLKMYSSNTFEDFDENLDASKFPKFKNIDL